ncbi:hypothetical protein X727_23895 [Mesorhizobium sp. L103C119B0]|nr:hypothetical protein X727_23895 [Mesorhizobium sp. L103C119B0]
MPANKYDGDDTAIVGEIDRSPQDGANIAAGETELWHLAGAFRCYALRCAEVVVEGAIARAILSERPP